MAVPSSSTLSKSFVEVVEADPSNPSDKLIFPQLYHDALNGKGDCHFIKKLDKKSGKPALIFSEAEISNLIDCHKYTLIGKFQYGHPRMENIRRSFENLKLVGKWKVGLFDGRHIMIQLSNEEDYAHLFSKKFLLIDGKYMKFLKWSPDFDPSQEPPIIPIWYNLPNLKLHLFNHQVIYAIGTSLGRPLKLDMPTFQLTRPSIARILIERDITLPDVDEIWIGTPHNGYWQPIVMENKPIYCHHCKMFGHSKVVCFRLHPQLKPAPNKKANFVVPVEKLQVGIPSGNEVLQKTTEVQLTINEDIAAIIEMGNSQIPIELGDVPLVLNNDKVDISTTSVDLNSVDNVVEGVTAILNNITDPPVIETLPFETLEDDSLPVPVMLNNVTHYHSKEIVPEPIQYPVFQNVTQSSNSITVENLEAVNKDLQNDWMIQKARKKKSVELKHLSENNIIQSSSASSLSRLTRGGRLANHD